MFYAFTFKVKCRLLLEGLLHTMWILPSCSVGRVGYETHAFTQHVKSDLRKNTFLVKHN